MPKVLVTGAAGYIGSHTCVELLVAGYDIIAVDDLRNSKEEALRRVRALTGRDFHFYRADVADEAALNAVFSSAKADAVIHFAGLKAVGESVGKPLEYYRNNLNATISVLACMRRHGVKKIVFSSSATVYGVPEKNPIAENASLGCTNPYGWTKFMSEQILGDVAAAEKGFSTVLLRYFNPIGAHPSGSIGDDPNGIPNNLLPYITQVAGGLRPHLNIYGNDYPTSDGTGVRDYIHVVDLAHGHLAALKYADAHSGAEAVNLGTGRGCSVLEVVAAYEAASGVKIPYKFLPRRSGDIAVCYADVAKAEKLLGWRARLGLPEMCSSSHNWQFMNPKGYS